MAGAGPAQSCDKVLTVWYVEMRGEFFYYWRVGELGCLHKTGGVVWCLSNTPLLSTPLLPSPLFQSSSFSLPASSRLLSTFLCPIPFLTSLTPLLPGDAYTHKVTHPPSAAPVTCTNALQTPTQTNANALATSPRQIAVSRRSLTKRCSTLQILAATSALGRIQDQQGSLAFQVTIFMERSLFEQDQSLLRKLSL